MVAQEIRSVLGDHQYYRCCSTSWIENCLSTTVGSRAPALLPPHPGNNFVIPFATAQDARQFIEYIQGQCPGVTAFLTGNIDAPVVY
jgi:alpha-L-arabinofuranosidase